MINSIFTKKNSTAIFIAAMFVLIALAIICYTHIAGTGDQLPPPPMQESVVNPGSTDPNEQAKGSESYDNSGGTGELTHEKILRLTPEEARQALATLMKTNNDQVLHDAIETVRQTYADYSEDTRMMTGYEDSLKGEWCEMASIPTNGTEEQTSCEEIQMCFLILIDGWLCDLTVGTFDTLILSPANIGGVFEKNAKGEWEAIIVKPADDDLSQFADLTPERAQLALVKMMRESDNPEWGGTRRRLTALEELDYPDDFDFDSLPPIYIENPTDVPEIMNEIEELEDGIIRIGFWHCDLEEMTFHSSSYAGNHYIRYDGDFYVNDDGEWSATSWLGAHGNFGLH